MEAQWTLVLAVLSFPSPPLTVQVTRTQKDENESRDIVHTQSYVWNIAFAQLIVRDWLHS